MLFGAVGDACLIWPGYFDTGVLSFLIGHLFYIYAFGFKPLNLPLGIACYAVAIMGRFVFRFNVNATTSLQLYVTLCFVFTFQVCYSIGQT